MSILIGGRLISRGQNQPRGVERGGVTMSFNKTDTFETLRLRQLLVQNPDRSFPAVGSLLVTDTENGHTVWTQDISVNSLTLLGPTGDNGTLTYDGTDVLVNGMPIGGGGGGPTGPTGPLGPTGPSSASSVLPYLFDYDLFSTHTNNISVDISGLSSDPAKFAGGVLASNGKIYCAPFNGNQILVIDPQTNRISYLTAPAAPSDTASWCGGVVGPDNRIYFCPYVKTDILVVDPFTDTVTTVVTGLGSGAEYISAVRGPNNKLYFCPKNTDVFADIMVVDVLSGLSPTIYFISDFGIRTYSGIVQGANGLLYSIPYYRSDVSNARIFTIDTRTDTLTSYNKNSPNPNTIPALPCSWLGGVLGTDGRIYCMPASGDKILVINTDPNDPSGNPAGDCISTIDVSGLIEVTPFQATLYWGGVLAFNNIIYGIPNQASSVLTYNIVTGDPVFYDISGIKTGTSSWTGGVLAPNGKIYGIPYDATGVLTIRSGYPTIQSVPWMLGPRFNKL